ncbi:response regulator [Oxalobacteraceae bacterium OM1]|nr:response regulator [Oxalobacteraceae bacterium OM1]
MQDPAIPLKILYVEDELLTCSAMSALLRALGHEVVACVTSAEEALDLVAAGCEFSVLVTDIKLPGISGIELAKRAYAARPGLSIVFATGLGYLVAQELPFRFALLSKPFSPEHLRHVLAHITAVDQISNAA